MTKSIMPVDTDFLIVTQAIWEINLVWGFSELKSPYQKMLGTLWGEDIV